MRTILRGFAERYFPQASGATLSMKSCIFTNSPDEHFIIDTHPEYPQVAFASGMTGHGFKFCSVVGEILADLSQHGQTSHTIDNFTPQSEHGMTEALHINDTRFLKLAG